MKFRATSSPVSEIFSKIAIWPSLSLTILNLFFLDLLIEPLNGQTVVDANQVVVANNEFAIDLCSTLSKQKGNFVMSPFSIDTCLAMTSVGARGNTATQMMKVLHLLTMDTKDVHLVLRSLLDGLNQTNDFDSRLVVVNSIWAQKGYDFLDPFKKRLMDDYRSELKVIDLTGWPNGSNREVVAAARKQINDWVSDKTQGKIKEILPADLPRPNTRLLLVNAIYFKGMWRNAFDKQETTNSTFFLNASDSINVPMMHITEWFNYATNDDFQMLELEYFPDRFSMVILLPTKKSAMLGSDQKITLSTIQDLYERQQLVDVNVSLPKFKQTSEYDLKQTLQKLGMTDAYSEDSADFSGITSAKPFFIGDSIHQAFVNVDEDGTEAAAATGIGVSDSGSDTPSNIKTFNADHPFLYFIRDNQTKAILLLGWVSNPSEE